MNSGQIAVATVTWARSPCEEALLGRSLSLLAAAGLPLAIADKGASATFASYLRRLPGATITVPSEQGLVAQVQASFAVAAAFGRPFILYVEPDKEFFFEHRMSNFLRRVPDQRDIGVALASRSEQSFHSFPPMQRYTEGIINHLCAELVGLAGDYSYGPFVMNRALLPHVETLNGRLGWGWRFSAFLAAHRHRLGVLHVTDEYPCPPDQRHENEAERMYRMRQLSENILGLVGS